MVTYSSLPITGNVQGDVRSVRDTGIQYYWSVLSSNGEIDDWIILNERIGSGFIYQDEKFVLEMELAHKFASSNNYKEMIFDVDGQLTDVNIYADNTKTIQLFSLELSYTNSQLTQSVLTRISDGATLTKTLVYNGSELSTITKIHS